MSSEPTLEIIYVLVTYNRLEKLKIALENISKVPFSAIVVVDNNSNDGTKEWLSSLKSQLSNLEVVTLTENLGGAGGFYHGFDYARVNFPNADWLLCADDDAYPRDDIVDTFLAHEISSDVGAVASAVYLPSGKIAEMNRPVLNPFSSLRTFFRSLFLFRDGFHIDKNNYFKKAKSIEVDAISFVGCFVRMDIVKHRDHGLPMKELFIYGDDSIYTYRIKSILDRRNIFFSDLKFVHDCETHTNSDDQSSKIFSPTWKVYYVARNSILWFKEISGNLFFLLLMIKLPLWILDARKYSDKPQYFRLLYKGVFDGLKGRFNVDHSEIKRI